MISFAQVTEACLGGNLLEWIDQLKGQEVVICRIAQEVTGVLAHCHSRYLGWISTNRLFFFGYQTFWAIPRWDWTALVTSFSLEKPTKTIYSHVCWPVFFVYIYLSITPPCCLQSPPNAEERNVCHRDLKLENILFLRRSLDSPIRVADFGLSKQCPDPTHPETNRLEIGREEVEHQKPSPWVPLVGGGLVG